AEHLDLDVPRLGDEPFEEHAAVAEVAGRQALDRGEGIADRRFAFAHPHADAAAAGGSLQHDREADLARRVASFFGVAQEIRARGERDAAGAREIARGVFQAEVADVPRRRTDEYHARLGTRLSEGGVFRQEPVAWVDRLGPGGA